MTSRTLAASNLQLAEILITLSKLPANHKYLMIDTPSKATLFALRRLKFNVARIRNMKQAKQFAIKTK